MTREECEKAIEIIDRYIYTCALVQKQSRYEVNEAIKTIDNLIAKHFDNPPLKFEDLTMGMGYTIICDGKS